MQSDNAKREYWEQLVNQCIASGLTYQRWCTEHNVSYHSLKRWRQVFLDDKKHNAIPGVIEPKWMELAVKKPVSIQNPTPTNQQMKVNIGKASIELPNNFDADTLHKLLGVLSSYD